jgi:hypothetical protein
VTTIASRDQAGAVLCIDLGAIVANWRLLRRRVTLSECAAVVKADAYGLGAAEVAPALLAAGCRHFFRRHPGRRDRAAPLPGVCEIHASTARASC